MTCCLPGTAIEREFYFDRIDDNSGLLQNSVLSLLQGSDGMIWVGTQAALHQFDGYRFRIFEHDVANPASLPDSAITALAETEDGHLWVGTSANGIARFAPATGRFESRALAPDAIDRSSRQSITALRLDPSRGLWIGSRGGLDLLSAESNGREPIAAAAKDVAVGVVRDLLLDSRGDLWVASSSGLWRVKRDSRQLRRVAATALDDVSSIFEDQAHNVYIGTASGLFRVDGGGGEVSLAWPGEPGARIDAIAEDHAGTLWLAVRGQGLAT
ncbi:MAG TPA: two-component regulator propeller domain-containing protein, partial [Dokdonella sp.]|nr:two-component regulator propeller domain-containing protein [Dokdonella sp.]